MHPMRKLLLLAVLALAFMPPFNPAQPNAITGEGGNPIGGSFLIDNRATDLSYPSVAYNSARNEYVAVYQADSNQTIMSARIPQHGAVDYESIAYHASQELKNPDLAYNTTSGEFLVVWEYNDGTRNRIYGRLVLPDKSMGAEFNLGTPGAIRDRYKPAVAYASTSNKFLVVWESVVWQSGGTSDVEAQIVTGAGALEGTNFLVAQGDWQFNFYEPDLAYNRSRNEYLVAWSQEERSVSQFDIFARRVTANGVILDPTAITIGYHTTPETAPAVGAIPTSPNFGMYSVAWELHYTATDHDIYERAVSGLGVTEPVQIVVNSTANESHPAIAGNEVSDTYLVTWTLPYSPPFVNVGIWGRPLSLNGIVIGQQQLLGGLFADYSAVTSGPGGDFLTVYQDPNLIMPITLDIWGRFWGHRALVPLAFK